MISPVIMKDCGPSHLPSPHALLRLGSVLRGLDAPLVWNLTVVSVVDGKAFSNRRARSGSFIREVTSSITFSMASEWKVRQRSSGRWNGRCRGPLLSGRLLTELSYLP